MRAERARLLREDEAIAYFDDDRLAAIDRLVALSGEQGDLRACVEWVEQAKGRELARRLVTVPLPAPRNTPAALVKREAEAARDARAAAAALAGPATADPAQIRRYEHAELLLRETWREIARFDPEFTSLRTEAGASWPELAATVREAAGPDGRSVVLVQYYVRAEVTAVLGITADREPMLELVPGGAGRLREILARHFPRTLPGPSADGAQWQEAMAPLVAPIGQWTEAGDVVYLCAHDVLHHLPLHAVDLDGMPLGERNIVAYVPSGTVLRSCLARPAAQPRGALILGDATIAADPASGGMPVARNEAMALAEEFQTHGAQVRIGLGDEASGRVLDEALRADPRPDVVHLAVHGSFDQGTPMDSGLQLADGRLTAAEVLALPLRAGLVTLSSCQSGASVRRPGDELLGLTRAFIYAGAPSVLVSLWQVDQIATSMIMASFYRAWLAGSPKGVALWQAQREVRRADVRDVLRHLDQARARLDGDRRAQFAVELSAAVIVLWASDVPAARQACAALLARPDLTAGERSQARSLERRITSRAGTTPDSPDYGRRPYDTVAHWAPFMLVGDWR
jgi:CHAT domain-containing protein